MYESYCSRAMRRDLGLRVGVLRRIFREDGFRLCQGELEWTGIELKEQLTLGDVLAFGEVKCAELPGDL
jgi:hypothetical protein